MKHTRLFGILLAVAFFATVCVAGMAAAQDEYDLDEATDEALFGGLACGGMICLIVLIPVIITVLIAVWVYKDATKRGMSGILWVIVVIFVPYFIGLIIYLIVRRSHPELPQGGAPPMYQQPPPGYQPPPPGYQPPPQPPQ